MGDGLALVRVGDPNVRVGARPLARDAVAVGVGQVGVFEAAAWAERHPAEGTTAVLNDVWLFCDLLRLHKVTGGAGAPTFPARGAGGLRRDDPLSHVVVMHGRGRGGGFRAVGVGADYCRTGRQYHGKTHGE